MKKSFLMIFSLALVLTIVLVGCNDKTNNKEVVKIRLGHAGPPGDVMNQSIDLLSEYVKEHTDGKYVIENFGASQLGNERDLIEGISLGTIDMTLVTNPPLDNFIPEASFYELPGLYTDLDHVHKVANSDVVRDYFAEKTLEKNMRLLAVTDGGFRSITSSVKPINELDDLRGLKIRVQESPLIEDTYHAIPGASPTPIPVGDLYTSLEQGIIDGQENPPILINDLKLAEVQKYLTLTEHSYFPRHLFINEEVWSDLPEDVQDVFIEGSKEMEKFKNDYYKNESEQALEELKERGLEVNEPDDDFLDELFELMEETVYPKYYKDIGGGDKEKGEKIVQEIIDMQ